LVGYLLPYRCESVFCELTNKHDIFIFVRLASCLAFELLCGIGMCAGAGAGLWLATNVVRDSLVQHEAVAATRNERPPLVSVLSPRRLEPTPVPVLQIAKGPSTIYGSDDDTLMAGIRGSEVTRVKINHGGTSLSLRLDFASGARAAFKPKQTHYQPNPRREIAAYRLDRLLGIGHVPPAISGGVEVAKLIAAADPAARGFVEKRLQVEAEPTGDMLYGEFSWWIPELKNATIMQWRVDEDDGIDAWRDMLRPAMPLPDKYRDFVAQIGSLIVFDFVIDNSDRWTGSNTKGSVDGKYLYFMDNTLSFTQFTRGHTKNLTYLQRVGRFSRSLIERMRSLTKEQLQHAMAPRDVDAELGELLTDAEMTAVLARRDYVIEYVDSLVDKYGADKVLVFP
jgi:hypothetical protein